VATPKSTSATDKADKAARVPGITPGCMILFTLPFMGAGLMSIVTGIQALKDDTSKASKAIVTGALFTGVATILIIVAIRGNRKVRAGALKQAANPDQPWLWNPEWASGEIHSKTGATVAAAGFFAVFWNAISWTIAFNVMRELPKNGDKKLLLVLIFPAIGLLLFGWFCYALLQHLKYGVAKFRMLSVPGVLGGTLRGAVEVPVQIDPPEGFKTRLVCVRRVTSSSGKNRSTSEHLEWEDEKIIMKDLLGHDRTRTGIPVFFNIPFDLPETMGGNPSIVWRLTVEAEVRGIDFSASFDVPVFKTPESSEEAGQQPDPTAAYQPNEGEYHWPANSPIRLTERGDSLEVYFPPARNKGMLLFLFLFSSIWTAASWFMFQVDIPILFPIVFGLFDLIILLIFFSMLLHAIRIEASAAGLKIHTSFVVPTGTRVVTPAEISHIELHQGMSSGDRVWYDIRAQCKNRRRHVLGSGISGKRQAAWLASRIAERIGAEFKER
jgi:hypothetical protein